MQGNLPQKIPKSSSTTTRSSRKTSTYLVRTFPHLEKVSLESATTTQKQAKRQNGRPRCEYVDMGNVYDCHSASRCSSWKGVTKKLVRVIDWQQSSWIRTTFLTDLAVQLSTAKTHVFSDSVLCMVRFCENPVSAWKEKIDWFMKSSQCRELDRVDGSRDPENDD